MANDVAQNGAASGLNLGLAVGEQALHQIFVGNRRVGAAVKECVPIAHNHRIVVSLAADHHAVDVFQMLGDLFVGGDAAVNQDFKFGKFLFEAVNIIVFQRRHFAVFFGRKAVEPRIAGVDDKGFAGGFAAQRADKIGHGLIFGLAVDADAVFYGNGNLHRVLHGVQTVGHQIHFIHQTCAERAFLHARAGATAVDIRRIQRH